MILNDFIDLLRLNYLELFAALPMSADPIQYIFIYFIACFSKTDAPTRTVTIPTSTTNSVER